MTDYRIKPPQTEEPKEPTRKKLRQAVLAGVEKRRSTIRERLLRKKRATA